MVLCILFGQENTDILFRYESKAGKMREYFGTGLVMTIAQKDFEKTFH